MKKDYKKNTKRAFIKWRRRIDWNNGWKIDNDGNITRKKKYQLKKNQKINMKLKKKNQVKKLIKKPKKNHKKTKN